MIEPVWLTTGGTTAETPPQMTSTTVSATIATARPRRRPQPCRRTTAGLSPIARNKAMKIRIRIPAALRTARKVVYASSSPRPATYAVTNGLRRSGRPGIPNGCSSVTSAVTSGGTPMPAAGASGSSCSSGSSSFGGGSAAGWVTSAG